MGMYDLESYSEDVQRCMRCGFCKSLCPTYEFVGWESGSPRGRMLLIKGLIDKELEVNEYVADRIYKCVLCGYCLWRCPPGVRTIDAIKACRKFLVDSGFYPRELDDLEEKIVEKHNLYGLPNASRLKWLDLMNLPNEVSVNRKADVVYFPGCVTSLSSRGVNIAFSTSKILDKMGLDWTLIGEEEWCCGNPLLLSGKLDHLKDIVEHNVEAIRNLKAKILVTSCAGCYRMFAQEYPKLIGDLGFKVYHISQLIEERLDLKGFKIKDREKVTYHDPCELGRQAGIYEPPRRIVKEIFGNLFIEIPKNRALAKCCGGNRVTRIVEPEISRSLALKKLAEVQSVGARKVVTACPSCVVNLSEVGGQVEVLDLTEVVAEAMRLT
ncbi:(Fe-S)-binding protein [Candidatus Bathyarchaeota archaeon]|nr:(Fe-S)-binding protein [Candidatus Bathyarchaeota archaeon]